MDVGQAAAEFDWVAFLDYRGPLYLIFALLVVAVVRYGPRLVKAHLEFMDSSKKTQEQLAASYDKLASNCDRQSHSLHHLAAAGKAATSCDDVHSHLDRAQESLRV